MTRPSLRWIFLVPILMAIIVGFTIFAVYADRVERINRIADIDAELIRAERRGSANPTADQPPALPPAEDAEPVVDLDTPVQLLIDPDGTVVSTGASGNPFAPSTIDRLLTMEGFHTIDAENYRVWITSPDDRLTSVTAFSLDLLDSATSDFRRALALGGGVIVALVTAVVWLLVRGLTRPITAITAAATRIADGDLDAPLDVSSRSSELTDLGNDLDRMLVRLKSTLDESERSAADATQARDDMQRFLADMAHELRTPLTALKGYSDLYAGGMLAGTTDVDRAMSRIGSESERLYRLADDMLELARHGTADEPTEVVDVAAIAAKVTADLRAANPEHHITLHCGPGHQHVTGTPARIHQAILNLGANACDHGTRAGKVVIRVDNDDTAVTVQVIDHGPGVDPGDRAQIFLPFYRADTSRSRYESGGAGLGLALTKQIADRHHGTVDVGETPGGGATFTLSFPAHVQTAAPDSGR